MSIGQIIAPGIVENIIRDRSKENMVLKSTKYNFDTIGSVLSVKVERVFVNDTPNTIEAIMTFPVPVLCAVFGLQYEHKGRIIRGVIQKKAEARKNYEEALDNGKVTLLHEELVKGIHMLSVGNIQSGEEVKVEVTFSLLAQDRDNSFEWNIPVTHGQVYGCSPLAPSDDIVVDYQNTYKASYSLEERAVTSRVYVNHKFAHQGEVILNKSIILRAEKLYTGADQNVVLYDGHSYASYAIKDIISESYSKTPQPIAVLCDISGSMSYSDNSHISRYDLMKNALIENASFAQSHPVKLFAFNNNLLDVAGDSFYEQVSNLPHASGGTEIGKAINTCIDNGYKNILVITDGQSYDLDIEAIAKRGVRINSLLVSESAFQAQMGHLSALTGGMIVFGHQSYVTGLNSLLTSMKTYFVNKKMANKFQVTIGNRHIELSKIHEVEECEANPVSALFASSILKFFDKSEAGKIAEKNHIVSHATSLILVDDSVEASDTLPVTVKVAVPSYAGIAISGSLGAGSGIMRSAGMGFASASSFGCEPLSFSNHIAKHKGTDSINMLSVGNPFTKGIVSATSDIHDLVSALMPRVSENFVPNISASSVDWSHINAFIQGNYGSLSNEVLLTIQKIIKGNPSIKIEAQKKNMDTTLYILWLVSQNSQDRNAQRLARKYQ